MTLPEDSIAGLVLAGAHPDTRAEIDAELRAHYYAEAAALLRAQHAAVYEDAGQKVASGLLRGADLLDAARTSQEG